MGESVLKTSMRMKRWNITQPRLSILITSSSRQKKKSDGAVFFFHVAASEVMSSHKGTTTSTLGPTLYVGHFSVTYVTRNQHSCIKSN
jgi:hypothetical protein